MRDSSNNESSSKSNSFSTLRSQKKPPVENLINSPGRERKSTFGLHRANLEPKEGFLKKQGGRIKTWKRRWFCLTNNQIEYSVGRGVCFDYFSIDNILSFLSLLLLLLLLFLHN